MKLIKSFIFNICIFVMIVITCIISLPLLFLPRKQFLSKLVYFLGWYFIFISKLLYNIKIEISGLENLHKHNNCIIASAHQSMFETFVFNYLVPDAFFVIKKELLFIPLYNLYLKKLGYVPIEREKVTKKNLNFYKRISHNVLIEKRKLIIFPHGTRVKADQEYPIKKGVYKIYKNLNIPCIPVYLNSGNFWPRNSFMKHTSNIKIIFKEPILEGLENDDFLKQLSNKIHY